MLAQERWTNCPFRYSVKWEKTSPHLGRSDLETTREEDNVLLLVSRGTGWKVNTELLSNVLLCVSFRCFSSFHSILTFNTCRCCGLVYERCFAIKVTPKASLGEKCQLDMLETWRLSSVKDWDNFGMLESEYFSRHCGAKFYLPECLGQLKNLKKYWDLSSQF